jgi:REP element-mobilizing transposase RayT
MPDTDSQIYIQTVFAVQGRENLISTEHKEELHKYITGIVTNQVQKLLTINCMPDHTHILIGLRPAMSLSNLMREVKADSCNFINQKKWICGRFSWQEGYAAFSYGHSQLTSVIQYIQNQERHHAKTSFRDEYLKFLERFNVSYNPKYLFDFNSSSANSSNPGGAKCL